MYIQQNLCHLLRASSPKPKPALFLALDGVLIADKHHLSVSNQVKICLGAQSLLKHAKQQSLPVVVITIQSGVARGYFSWDDYAQVTDHLLSILGPHAPIAAIYANSHGPNAPSSGWRKPSPAMLLTAAQNLNLDLIRSLLICDRLSD